MKREIYLVTAKAVDAAGGFTELPDPVVNGGEE